MSGLRNFDPWAAIGKPNPRQGAIEQAADAALERAEREAIMSELELPQPGSDARRVIDLAHESMVRGLIAAARPGNANY